MPSEGNQPRGEQRRAAHTAGEHPAACPFTTWARVRAGTRTVCRPGLREDGPAKWLVEAVPRRTLRPGVEQETRQGKAALETGTRGELPAFLPAVQRPFVDGPSPVRRSDQECGRSAEAVRRVECLASC